MKTKKTLYFFAVPFLIGSVVTVAIDRLIGVSFQEVGFGVQVTHKAIYMLWGALIVWRTLIGTGKWLE